MFSCRKVGKTHDTCYNIGRADRGHFARPRILRGSWRGLFLSLSGVIVLILAMIGANLGAKALTQPVSDWATPKIEERIAAKVEKTLEEQDAGAGAERWKSFCRTV